MSSLKAKQGTGQEKNVTAVGAALSAEQLGPIRHIDNLSRQLPDDWSLMQGNSVGQDAFDALRFQLSDIAVSQAGFTPAPRSDRLGHGSTALGNVTDRGHRCLSEDDVAPTTGHAGALSTPEDPSDGVQGIEIEQAENGLQIRVPRPHKLKVSPTLGGIDA